MDGRLKVRWNNSASEFIYDRHVHLDVGVNIGELLGVNENGTIIPLRLRPDLTCYGVCIEDYVPTGTLSIRDERCG